MVHLSNIAKHYGNTVLYRNGSLQLNPGDKVGLVGPNGSGKTTIFRIIVGEEKVDEGHISKSDRTVIGYFSQDIAEMRGKTVLEEVKSAAGRVSELGMELARLEAQLAEPLSEEEMARVLDKYGEIQSEFEQRGGYDLDSRVSEIVTGLGFAPENHHRMTESYSGGWKMRIALAKILILNPDVLLLDEPTNHLDLESIIWLESWLKEFTGALLMTCHDREFMNRVVGKVLEVANKAISSYSGNYSFYEKERVIRRTQLIAAAKRQEEMLAKEEDFIARFAARASHAAQVQSRVKKLEKIERIEIPPEEKVINFEWTIPPRGGDEVVKFKDLAKSWPTENGKEVSVFTGASGLVKRMDRVAVVGVNGAGKSTLLKIISGQTQQSGGDFTLGSSIEVGYFSQNSLDVLDSDSTIFEEVQKHLPTASVGYIKNLLGAFKFSGDEVDKKIFVLSGGEKSRVVLATILARPVNLLVLDEPTNHLDIQSREVLLEAVKGFPGTVVIVSHDRHFLREITTRVFCLDQHKLSVIDGTWDYFTEKNPHYT